VTAGPNCRKTARSRVKSAFINGDDIPFVVQRLLRQPARAPRGTALCPRHRARGRLRCRPSTRSD
jgi:hypothetical protein